MKKSVPHAFTPSALILLLAFAAGSVHADSIQLRIGGSSFGLKSHGGHSSYGPVTSFGHSYGPVTSMGSGHILSGRNQYNLNTTRPGLHIQQNRFKTFRDRNNFRKFRHHNSRQGFGYKRGFRDGFRAGQSHGGKNYHRYRR